jgi:hypothetical protein
VRFTVNQLYVFNTAEALDELLNQGIPVRLAWDAGQRMLVAGKCDERPIQDLSAGDIFGPHALASLTV